VRSTDSLKLRKKASQVREIVDKELGFASRTAVVSSSSPSPSFTPQWHQPAQQQLQQHPEDYLTTYLYVNGKKRVVGLASTELIRMAYPLETNYSRSKIGQKATIGIHQVWVHSKYRGKNIASRLLDTIREKMVFGYVVPCSEIALSSPTEAGIAFAKGYVKKRSTSDVVLVYDFHR